MQRREGAEPLPTEEQQPPLWVPPPPPPLGPRERLRMWWDRFGFLVLSGLIVGVLALLIVNEEWLLRSPAIDQGAPSLDPTAQLTITLSVITVPSGAAVYIDGDSVGRAPVWGHVLTSGTHRLSLRTDAARLDTVVTLTETPALLRFALGEEEALPEAAAISEEAPPEVDPPEEVIPSDDAPPEPAPEPIEATPSLELAADTPETDASEADASVAAEPEPGAAEPEPEAAAPAPGQLRLTSQPSGASVVLDGEAVGITPLVLPEVAAGSHALSLRHDGYEPFATTVEVLPGEAVEVNGRLAALMGTLRILARPWGAIYIDGTLHKRESSVWYAAELPAGPHRVRVEHPQLGKWENTVEVPAGGEESVVVDFNRQETP